MNTRLLADLDRVESALETLVDSIVAYKPSPQAAETLIAADIGLGQGLEELSHHQQNHALLLSLRATHAALDEQIKTNLRTLAGIRRDLIDAAPPRTLESTTAPAVDYETLLNFAQRIAKYTNSRPSLDQVNEGPSVQGSPGSGADAQGSPAQGQKVEDGGDGDVENKQQGKTDKARQFEPPGQQDMGISTPWPDDFVIRKGALGMIQGATERGEEPEELDLGGMGAGQDPGQANGDMNAGQGGDQSGQEKGRTDAGGRGHAQRQTREEAEAEAARRRAEAEREFEGFDLLDEEDG